MPLPTRSALVVTRGESGPSRGNGHGSMIDNSFPLLAELEINPDPRSLRGHSRCGTHRENRERRTSHKGILMEKGSGGDHFGFNRRVGVVTLRIILLTVFSCTWTP